MLYDKRTIKEVKEKLVDLAKAYEDKSYMKDYSTYIDDVKQVYMTIVSQYSKSNYETISSIVKYLEKDKVKLTPINTFFLQDVIRFLYTDNVVYFNKYLIVNRGSEKKIPLDIKYYNSKNVFSRIYSELDYIFAKGGIQTAVLIAILLTNILEELSV